MAHFGEELAFLKTQALALQNIPVTFDNDYQPALADVPKRVLPFQVSPAVALMLAGDPDKHSLSRRFALTCTLLYDDCVRRPRTLSPDHHPTSSY